MFKYLCMKCIYYWPEDGRPYVALGRILGKQSKAIEARSVYEKGCQATLGENAYIWQVSLLYSMLSPSGFLPALL